MTAVDVYVEIDGADVHAGRLYGHHRRGAESATFSYQAEYLARSDAYGFDPALPLQLGSIQTAVAKRLFNAFADAAPDRWGRSLIQRQQRLLARERGSATRRLTELDYLLGARDDLRQGALRFRDLDTGTFLASDEVGVPAVTDLPELLALAERIEGDDMVASDLRRLVRAGSSLGGARPKTHVRAPDGRAAIAKFPSSSIDEWNVMAWEKVALDLAGLSGIAVPRSELIDIAGRSVLIVDRFDRTAFGYRIGYASALTMLEASDGDRRSYVDIAEVVEERSSRTSADLVELWRRVVFSVLISNTDDHLRNHAFLHTAGDSWVLSPAFDINPDPSMGPKELSTSITDYEFSARLEPLLEVAELFRLTRDDAVSVIKAVAAVVSGWREHASSVGLSRLEIDRMEPAFVHAASEDVATL